MSDDQATATPPPPTTPDATTPPAACEHMPGMPDVPKHLDPEWLVHSPQTFAFLFCQSVLTALAMQFGVTVDAQNSKLLPHLQNAISLCYADFLHAKTPEQTQGSFCAVVFKLVHAVRKLDALMLGDKIGKAMKGRGITWNTPRDEEVFKSADTPEQVVEMAVERLFAAIDDQKQTIQALYNMKNAIEAKTVTEIISESLKRRSGLSPLFDDRPLSTETIIKVITDLWAANRDQAQKIEQLRQLLAEVKQNKAQDTGKTHIRIP